MALQVEEIWVQKSYTNQLAGTDSAESLHMVKPTVHLDSDQDHEYTDHIAQATVTTPAPFWVTKPSK